MKNNRINEDLESLKVYLNSGDVTKGFYDIKSEFDYLSFPIKIKIKNKNIILKLYRKYEKSDIVVKFEKLLKLKTNIEFIDVDLDYIRSVINITTKRYEEMLNG